MACQMRIGGDQTRRSTTVPLSVLEPTPIDPTRIVTVPKVPFDSSPLLGKIVDETVLAALCDVLKSHESSFRASPMIGLSPKMTSLLLEVESICNDKKVDDFCRNPEGVSSWSEDGVQRLRNVEFFVNGDNEEDASSSCAGGDLRKVKPTRRSFSPCCSSEPSCDTIPVQKNKSSMSSVTSSEFPSMKGESSTCTTTTTFRTNQTEQWYQRYLDLVKFRETYGHCLVPLNWPTNPSLAHWVSRLLPAFYRSGFGFKEW